ncbi:M50 family metallopeptidase [Lysinibacillus sp. KU-BSD001]|uniref:M50 family metallopeptidase n=1 Tax=Lysinibacillus sp. KU-BSD001 TaxID=3141328 RepID=UPI0036E296DD
MAKIKIHPVFLMMLLLWALSGNIAQYFLVLVSLLWHEAGHLLIAKLVGAKVKDVTLLPFGARIQFFKGQAISYTALIWIAIGGPIFTLLAYLISPFIPSLFQKDFATIQLVLLCVNLLPIYPLDGGQILCNSLLKFKPKKAIYEGYVSISLCLITIAVGAMLLMLPQSIFFVMLSLLLWSEILDEWRFRKYRTAFEKVIMNRLT